MSKNSQQTLHFRIVPSKQLKAVVAALHACAILACWLNALPTAVRLIFIAGLVVLWLLSNKRWKTMPVYLNYHSHSNWQISGDGLNYLNAAMLGSTVITSRVIFLHYETDDEIKGTLLIARDSLHENQFRRLKVRLKLSGGSRAP